MCISCTCESPNRRVCNASKVSDMIKVGSIGGSNGSRGCILMPDIRPWCRQTWSQESNVNSTIRSSDVGVEVCWVSFRSIPQKETFALGGAGDSFKRLIFARGSEVEGSSNNYRRIGNSCGITIISYMSGEVKNGDVG